MRRHSLQIACPPPSARVATRLACALAADMPCCTGQLRHGSPPASRYSGCSRPRSTPAPHTGALQAGGQAGWQQDWALGVLPAKSGWQLPATSLGMNLAACSAAGLKPTRVDFGAGDRPLGRRSHDQLERSGGAVAWEQEAFGFESAAGRRIIPVISTAHPRARHRPRMDLAALAGPGAARSAPAT